MGNSEDKLINKIENLIRLSSSFTLLFITFRAYLKISMHTKASSFTPKKRILYVFPVYPAVVDKAIESMGAEDAAPSTRPNMSRKNSMLYGIGYTDGKAFQNAGDKEQLHS